MAVFCLCPKTLLEARFTVTNIFGEDFKQPNGGCPSVIGNHKKKKRASGAKINWRCSRKKKRTSGNLILEPSRVLKEMESQTQGKVPPS